jgi:glycosyltransferase involved in cell wall biosynthesis
MLGWEFPPHISGGLGTACLGLTRGLTHQGVEVLFVMPRAHGDEDAGAARLIGADQVPLALAETCATAPELDTWAELRAAAGLAATNLPVDEALADVARRLRMVAVASPLTPYLTETEYLYRLAEMRSREPVADGAAQGSGALGMAAAAGEDNSEGVTYLTFTGSYGPELMAEVARFALVVAELSRREAFDVVHAHDWMTIPAAMAASRISGKPLVLHVHATEYDRSGENVNEHVRDVEQVGLDAADRVIAVSHFLAGVLQRRYSVDPEKIRVVHNAVTQAEQRSSWLGQKSVNEPIVLYLGRVTFQKGPDYFVEAAARVVAIEPNVKFVISGSGDMLPQIIQRVAELDLARHVHFTGFLRGSDVERMYAMADIYVMPSVSEPFGISPLEAMAADVPVIVSRQSGVSEVVTNALKVDFWDVTDMANKILALLRYPALGRQLSDEARSEVRRLRWEVRGQLVRDIYREVAS